MLSLIAAAEDAGAVFAGGLLLIIWVGLVVLQIALCIAVFKTSKATQDTAYWMQKAYKELRFIADQYDPAKR